MNIILINFVWQAVIHLSTLCNSLICLQNFKVVIFILELYQFFNCRINVNVLNTNKNRCRNKILRNVMYI